MVAAETRTQTMSPVEENTRGTLVGFRPSRPSGPAGNGNGDTERRYTADERKQHWADVQDRRLSTIGSQLGQIVRDALASPNLGFASEEEQRALREYGADCDQEARRQALSACDVVFRYDLEPRRLDAIDRLSGLPEGMMQPWMEVIYTGLDSRIWGTRVDALRDAIGIIEDWSALQYYRNWLAEIGVDPETFLPLGLLRSTSELADGSRKRERNLRELRRAYLDALWYLWAVGFYAERYQSEPEAFSEVAEDWTYFLRVEGSLLYLLITDDTRLLRSALNWLSRAFAAFIGAVGEVPESWTGSQTVGTYAEGLGPAATARGVV